MKDRLFDDPRWRGAYGGAEVARVTADDLFLWSTELRKSTDLLERIGPVRMPYPDMWIEAKTGPVRTLDRGKIAVLRFGVRLREIDLTIDDDVAFGAACTLWLELKPGALIRCYNFGIYMDGSGKCVGMDKPHRDLSPTEHDEWERRTEGIFGVGYLDTVIKEQAQYDANPLPLTAVLAVALMNCRNVSLVETPAYKSRASNPSVRKRESRVSYHTIRLPDTRSGASTTERLASVGQAMPHHLVRGHFKTYTAAAPLMGKLIGTYWWNWQARGAKDNGQVISDYRVGLPKT